MIRLRPAKPEDIPALVEIYRPYVEIGTASLEYDTPSVEEFGRRLESISAEFPYIVCEVDGELVGYSYAHRYKERFGYRFCAELTVYLKEGFGKKKARHETLFGGHRASRAYGIQKSLRHCDRPEPRQLRAA